MANATARAQVQTTPWTTDLADYVDMAIPGSGSTVFYSGTMLGRDANGRIINLDDTASAEFIGLDTDTNRITVASTDTAGDKRAQVDRGFQLFTMLHNGSPAAGDEGRKVYAKFNNEVQYTPGTYGNCVGRVFRVIDSTHVAIQPIWLDWPVGSNTKGWRTVAAAAATTLTKWDVGKDIIMPLTSSVAITFPAANSVSPGDTLNFINTSANSSVPTLTAAGTDTINGAATLAMSSVQYAALSARSDGVSKWYAAAQNVSGTLGATTFTGNVGLTSATLTITSTSASALTVGANGATNPVLKIDDSGATQATGLSIKGAAAASGVAIQVISSGTNEALTIDAAAAANITLNGAAATATGVVVGSATAAAGTVLNVISTNANAFTVGRQGSTTPVLAVNANTGSVVTGLLLTGAAAASGMAVQVTSSGANEALTIDAKAAAAITLNGAASTATGVIVGSTGAAAGTVLNVISTSANALTVGRQGATNPVLTVNANTATVVTGVKITGAAAAAGVAVAVTSSGTNENFTLDGKGAGQAVINGTATGYVSIGRGAVAVPLLSNTKTTVSAQNSTPTAAQLIGGYIDHNSQTGAGTATLDTAANIDTQIAANGGVAAATGDAFTCTYVNRGNQTVTITTNTGLTLRGTAAVPTLKNAVLTFVKTGAGAYDVLITLSA